MSGNYPPGVDAGHPHFNPPDMEHKHEWEPDELMHPVFEDGAAIFVEVCRWEKVLNTEPGYEGDRVVTESIPCEEQRRVRMEPVTVEVPDKGYTIGKDEFEDENGYLVRPVENALHDIEGHSGKDVRLVECDPDPDTGHVIADTGKYTITYAVATQTNREAD